MNGSPALLAMAAPECAAGARTRRSTMVGGDGLEPPTLSV
jgi:hypothetical protein